MFSFNKTGWNPLSGVKREFHIPGYSFCGPGTQYDERVARGEQGINALDGLCKQHDAVYNTTHQEVNETNRIKRYESDTHLRQGARQIWKGHVKGAGLGQRAAALAVDGLMGAKQALRIY